MVTDVAGASGERRAVVGRAGLARAVDASIGFLFSAYFGLIVGVSVIATMAKFQAGHSSLPQLVEIGSITFHWLHSVEMVMIALLFVLSLAAGGRSWRAAVAVILAGIWSIQGFVLLPVLDSQVSNLIVGVPSATSSDHVYYAALEGLKVLILLGAGGLSIAQTGRRAD